jgi:hypothetical protein
LNSLRVAEVCKLVFNPSSDASLKSIQDGQKVTPSDESIVPVSRTLDPSLVSPLARARSRKAKVLSSAPVAAENVQVAARTFSR